MGVFDDEIAIIQDIENNISDVIKQTVQKFGFVIVDYNTNKQLDRKGEDSKGKKLFPKYTKAYARIRVKKGLQVDHVDTHFTGKFHASITVEAREDEFVIRSNVEYDKYLVKKYGEDILGVQEQYLQEFVNNYLHPALKTMINDKLAKS